MNDFPTRFLSSLSERLNALNVRAPSSRPRCSAYGHPRWRTHAVAAIVHRPKSPARHRCSLASLAILSFVALLGSHAARAGECKGVRFPDEVQVEGTKLTLNGIGLRQATMLKVDVYVAALYVASRSKDAEAILASTSPAELTLHFVRDVGAGNIRKGWDEGFEKNAKAALPALKDRVATLNGWMSDVKSGQHLTFVFKSGSGVQVDVNGAVKGTIDGDDFARAFLAIWLGNPPNPELKAGLLGGGCG